MSLNFKTKLNQGLTPINLIIGGIIITIIVIITWHNLLESSESRQISKPAYRNLRAFAHGNKLDALRCEGQDLDGNGFVLCQAKDRQGQKIILQCGYDQSNSDCQIQ